jgi:hypothetical protein
MDAEDAWFVRCNHIARYGTDPHLEELTVHPPAPLLFLNIDGAARATALIWEHIEDAPGQPCPNPRVIIPRASIPNVVNGAVDVDVRSMGVRTPPAPARSPELRHHRPVPPAAAGAGLAVAAGRPARPRQPEHRPDRGHVLGGRWLLLALRHRPRVDHANLLLNQIIETPRCATC